MDEIRMEKEIEKKIKDGWLQARFAIEVLAGTKEAAKSALEKHVQAMEKEKNTIIYRKSFGDIKKILNPLPNIAEGWSNIVDVELVAKNFETLVYLVVTYGPSAIELLGPKKIAIDLGEGQAILNSLSELIHKYAAAGIGGIVIKT
jgi:hypothetical protein